MKKIIILSLIILIIGCKNKNAKSVSKNTTTEILIKVSNQKDFEGEIMPWISIKNPEKYIANLIDKENVIIKQNSAILIIDYPLKKPVEIEIKSASLKGFNKKELVQIISSEYKRIYEEEEKSTSIKTIPLKERKGVINRNKTNGKYGIWGHDIDDLDLSAIIIRKTENGKIVIELYVES